MDTPNSKAVKSKYDNEICSTYDRDMFNIFKTTRESLLSSLYNKTNIHDVLDVGSGTAETLIFLKNIFGDINVVAQDLSTGMLEVAKKKDSCIRTIECDVLNIKASLKENEKFDLITMCYLMGYVNPYNVLPILKDLTKDDGYIFIATSLSTNLPFAESVGKQFGIDTEKPKEDIFIPSKAEDFIKVVEDCGLDVVDFRTFTKKVTFESLGDCYDFIYTQGWGYQIIEAAGFANRKTEFINTFKHFIPGKFDDYLKVAFYLLKK